MLTVFDAMKELVKGNKIRGADWEDYTYVFYKEGRLFSNSNSGEEYDVLRFFTTSSCFIYELYKEEQKWYENKNNFPCLCAVFDEPEDIQEYALITGINEDNYPYIFSSKGNDWAFAIPIKKDFTYLLENKL